MASVLCTHTNVETFSAYNCAFCRDCQSAVRPETQDELDERRTLVQKVLAHFGYRHGEDKAVYKLLNAFTDEELEVGAEMQEANKRLYKKAFDFYLTELRQQILDLEKQKLACEDAVQKLVINNVLDEQVLFNATNSFVHGNLRDSFDEMGEMTKLKAVLERKLHLDHTGGVNTLAEDAMKAIHTTSPMAAW